MPTYKMRADSSTDGGHGGIAKDTGVEADDTNAHDTSE